MGLTKKQKEQLEAEYERRFSPVLQGLVDCVATLEADHQLQGLMWLHYCINLLLDDAIEKTKAELKAMQGKHLH